MSDFSRIVFPYCLKRLDDGMYVVLNRKYKPIGFDTSEHIEYESLPICHKVKGINRNTAARLSWENSDDVDAIFLYSDSCIPTENDENMNSYFERIKILAKYKIQ